MVATVPTVYGIETLIFIPQINILRTLQQYLPFTVLKLNCVVFLISTTFFVCCNSTYRLRYWNSFTFELKGKARIPLAHGCNSTYRLRYWNYDQLTPVFTILMFMLQQYLPFTVLKPNHPRKFPFHKDQRVATVPTVYGIETYIEKIAITKCLN